MIGISACLGGICCRYDGKSKEVASLKELVAENKAVLICPEVLGGLPIPRPPAEIQGGDGFDVWNDHAIILTNKGENVTEQYKKGAKKALIQLQTSNITTLILKENSPSCGSHTIYDGSFSGILNEGVGVATAYFILNGLTVFSEENWQMAVKETKLLK